MWIEDDEPAPAGVDFEGDFIGVALLRGRFVPEKVRFEGPAGVLGDFEEEVAGVDGAGDPDVVVGFTVVDPVHAAGDVGLEREVLVQELEHVLWAEGDVVDEEDSCLGRVEE